MKKLILLICSFLFIFSSSFSLDTKYKIIYSDNNLGKLNINTATQEEMLRAGVASSYVSKIISFRDIKGGIESIEELERISGIGSKTCKKLEKYFFIDENDIKLKSININEINEKDLRYYGFSTSEIKAINKYLSTGRIRNNKDLKKLISKKNYEKYKDLFRY
ncbi:helix-hairpin-helix domain-containing protein [Fusobacterium sp.]|uniref:ComEA family DNA-binding protein n=1 Tax=Fusobacterium sp. TaxID=68766 RepID=UPI002608EDF2|nr:helix-hairpin-helix domain-containing protein [Fusobacterium sp.]